jgi:transcriptional regulator with XRE-family HTH domain
MLLSVQDKRWESEKVFGARLREERDQRGWSQQEVSRRLAAELGIRVHSTAITRIELGERSVRLSEAQAIADVLELPLGKLLVSQEQTEIWTVQDHVHRLRLAEEGIDRFRDERAYHQKELRQVVNGAPPRLRQYLVQQLRSVYRISKRDAERRAAALLGEADDDGEHPEAS